MKGSETLDAQLRWTTKTTAYAEKLDTPPNTHKLQVQVGLVFFFFFLTASAFSKPGLHCRKTLRCTK